MTRGGDDDDASPQQITTKFLTRQWMAREFYYLAKTRGRSEQK